MKRRLLEVMTFLMVSSLAGLALNAGGPHLPLLRHYVAPGKFQIDLKGARELVYYRLNGLAVVYLDLRSPEQFHAGCIPGAINIADSKISSELKLQMQKAPAVITYGSDEDAIELAARLREMGLSNSPRLAGLAGGRLSHRATSMKPRLLLLARCLLGGTFLLAGALKLTATPELAQTILNYRLLPELWVGIVAAILPCLEIIPALALLAGLWLESSAALLGILSLIFAAAVTSVVCRHIDIDCGCFRGASGVESRVAGYGRARCQAAGSSEDLRG